MLSLKLIDFSGLDNMTNTLAQVVGVPGEGGAVFMPKEVLDVEAERRRGREAKSLATAVAAQRDHQLRLNSVARDFELGLPTSIPQPDGEEFPRKCHMQLRSQDQRAEIVKGFIQGPPNKTIYNSSAFGDSFGGSVTGSEEVKGGGGGPSKSNSCSCLAVTDRKSHSTGQLNSWNFLKPLTNSSGGGGKSPPHARSAKCHVHSRTSPKSSSASSTSSKHVKAGGASPSSSTLLQSGSSGTLSGTPPSLPTPKTTPPPPLHSHKPTFTEKLTSMFSDKGPGVHNPSSHLSSTPAPGMFARLLSDETKSKSKSSKVKGQPLSSSSSSSAVGWSGIKGDLKKIPPHLLPPTETQVYVVIPAATREEGLGRRTTTNKNGAGNTRNSPGDSRESFSSFSLAEQEEEEEEEERRRRVGGSSGSDRNGNGNERERAYSDSMLRTDRSSLLLRSSDMSESRMSLCYEGEDATTTTTTEVTEGGLTTEPDGPPSNLRRKETLQEGPSSFLYQHHHHHHHHQDQQEESEYSSTSMNVSTTPPPGTDFT